MLGCTVLDVTEYKASAPFIWLVVICDALRVSQQHALRVFGLSLPVVSEW
jgi:hypothetical protein